MDLIRRYPILTIVAVGGVVTSLAMTGVAGMAGGAAAGSPLVAYAIPIVLTTPPEGPIPWTFAVCNKAEHAVPAAIQLQGVLRPVPVSLDGAMLPAGGCTTARIELPAAPFAAVGWHAIPIAHGEEPIGTLGIARRPQVAKALNLKIEPESPTLTSVAGAPAGIIVHSQSADGSTPVAWHVKAETWFASGVAELGGGSEVVVVPLRCPSHVRMLWEVWPLRRDGHVVLSLGREPGQTGPVISKTVAVKARLTMREEASQGIITTIVILICLGTGGVIAYLLNTVLPLHRRRRQLRAVLHNIITELEQLYRCSSGYQDIRHLILCEARQVRSELNQFLTVNPELAVALDALEPAVDILKLKTWGLNRLSALRSQLPEPAGQGLGLLAVELLRGTCEHVADGLRAMSTGREQLMVLFQELDRAFSILASAGGEHPLVREALGRRCRELRTTIEALQKASDRRWRELCDAVPGLGAAVNAVEPEIVHPGDQHARELQMWGVSVALDWYRSARPLTADVISRLRLVFEEPRWDAFVEAHQIFRLQVTRTDKEIVDALLANTPCVIRPSHEPVRARELVAFTLWFEDDGLNYSSTRERWQCQWSVDGGPPQRSGFTMWYAFPAPHGAASEDHRVEIESFTAPDGVTVERRVQASVVRLLDTKHVRVPQSWFTTAGTLAIVQIITLFGLLSQEVNVIETRDPLAAVLILIAMGFGADTIRSLLAAGASRVAAAIAQATAPTTAAAATGASAGSSGVTSSLDAPARAASSSAGSWRLASADPPLGSQLARRLGL